MTEAAALRALADRARRTSRGDGRKALSGRSAGQVPTVDVRMRCRRESIMRAQAGDELVVKGLHVGDVTRHGVVIEVHGADAGPPYLVRWDDGHESTFFPSSDTVIEHIRQPAGQQTGSVRR